MFCNNCGIQVPTGTQYCPKCGNNLKVVAAGQGQGYGANGVGGGSQQGYGSNQVYSGMNRYPVQRARIDNIFSGLVHEKTPGAIMEFVIWIGFVILAILAMVTAILVEPNMGLGSAVAMWIFVMLADVAIAVLMAFRLRPITILSGYTILNLGLMIPYYIAGARINGAWNEWVSDDSVSPIIIILFIFLMMIAAAMITLGFIQFFSRFQFNIVLTILSIASAVLTIPLMLCTMFAVEGDRDWGNGIGLGFSSISYTFGSIVFILSLILIALYTIMFFYGPIDSTKSKIYVSSGGGGNVRTGVAQAYVQVVQGMYQGQSFPLQGREIVVGSAMGVADLVLPDPKVSHRHCAIRFNSGTGYYEVMDVSTNGVFVNGKPLQKNVYVALQRGTVIWIGHAGAQLRLG